MSARGASIAVVIVNYRTPDLALRCVHSLEAERKRMGPLEVLLVDGGSGDGSAEKLQAALAAPAYAGWVTLLPLELNGGFGWANNQAILRLLQRPEPPEFIHLLNPDTMIRPGAVAALAEALAEDPRIAAAGSQLFEADGRLSGSAFRFPSLGRELVRGANTPAIGRLLGVAPALVDYGRRHEAEWVTGASVMLRAEALRQAGLFDSGFFLYFEDVELMHRLRQHEWEIVHVPESEVVHIGGASTGVQDSRPGTPKRLPPYWHRARRRYLTLTRGRGGGGNGEPCLDGRPVPLVDPPPCGLGARQIGGAARDSRHDPPRLLAVEERQGAGRSRLALGAGPSTCLDVRWKGLTASARS